MGVQDARDVFISCPCLNKCPHSWHRVEVVSSVCYDSPGLPLFPTPHCNIDGQDWNEPLGSGGFMVLSLLFADDVVL